jgi:hypothetical protein
MFLLRRRNIEQNCNTEMAGCQILQSYGEVQIFGNEMNVKLVLCKLSKNHAMMTYGGLEL